MSADNFYTPKPNGLVSQLIKQGMQSRDLSHNGERRPQYPPYGNTGGRLPQIPDNKGKSTFNKGYFPNALLQSPPPPNRKSQKKITSTEMAAFLDEWFFDWLTLTVPNGTTGKGSRSLGGLGDKEVKEAELRLCKFATSKGLHRMRIGKGSDGYAAGMPMAFDPLADERAASIRTGHATNMPGMEFSGADGACKELAPAALSEIGPVLIARADVSIDISQEGLMDDLEAYARKCSQRSKMDEPKVISSSSGRSWTWGKGEVSVTVYQKDLERVHQGKLTPEAADENLCRIEFKFRPQKGRKAGLAILARDKGAGAILGTSLWVRGMVERIAEATGWAEDAVMGVERVESTPDPRTARDRADHGLAQYGKSFCKAMVADVVKGRFNGDWLAAEIDPEEIGLMVAEWVKESIMGHSAEVCTELGMDEVRACDEEAARLQVDLLEWIKRQKEETEDAQVRLSDVMEQVLNGRRAA